VLGAFYVSLTTPSPAEAGFFSLLGGSAHAQDTEAIQGVNDLSANSQTMALLQANVIPEKESKENSKDNNVSSDENINISNNALVPSTGPRDVSGNEEIIEASEAQTSIYVVRSGDTFSTIASMFDVSVDTILAANNLKRGAKLTLGEVLLILPISGVEHTVAKGQTLAGIAKLYKVEAEDIILYNGLEAGAKLTVGDKLMIPGASMADEGGDKPAANLGSAVARDTNYYATHPVQSAAGYFINPVPTGRKTQGLHGPGHRGIDIGAPKGTPIYASAGGSVALARNGWNGGYGNMAIIQHTNGTKTLYAHMSVLATSTGTSVSQGEIIGYVGSTGHSTGPHLHFEVFNAKNPGTDWSWKK
jgi:murein DD-endopeptidase MepM/ murein hydrolase activator NlpD